MKDMMAYKGYYGSVHYDDEDQVFHGKFNLSGALSAMSVRMSGVCARHLKKLLTTT